MNIRKYVVVCTTLLLLAQWVPVTISQVYAETNGPVDEQALTAFRSHLPDYVAMSTNTVTPVEEAPPAVQEFSFVEKTSRTGTNQPVILRFTSTYPADEVLVRIPKEGQVLASYFSDGESITHSHGEYWTLHTEGQQTEFTLPVVFETAGNYFLTVDHDADHFYLEVEESTLKSEDQKSSDIKDQENTDFKEPPLESQDAEVMSDIPVAVQPVIAAEKNLSISEEVIAAEEKRILAEITDQKRNTTATANVRNWSQFRSAWNNSAWMVDIRIEESFSYSSSILGSSLNKLNNSYRTIGSNVAPGRNASINMGTSGNSLQLENSTLNMRRTTIESESSGSQPLIDLDKASTFEITERTTILNRRNSPAVALNDRSTAFFFGFDQRKIIYNQVAVSPVRLSNNSRFELHQGGVVVGSNSASNNWIPPISSDTNSTITFSRTGQSINNVMMGGRINVSVPSNPSVAHLTTYRVPWNSVVAEITGVNGSIVNSSTSDPNDFSERYLANHNLVDYRSITVGASASDGFVPPPRPSYALLLEAIPLDGGNPTAETTTITQGESTTLHANPTETFNFVRWEVVSGVGSSIADETNATTTFTMGTADTVVQAVYQKKQGGDITVEYVDNTRKELAEPEIIHGLIEEEYETKAKEIDGYTLTEVPKNASGQFTEEAQTVTYVYTKDTLDPVLPVDPLAPDQEVDPENPPELPEDQGALSIDFASHFSFGTQGISAQTKCYYAQPQRLLNLDGTVNDAEERPNYIQVSDRRPEEERHGWQLAVTQNSQFMDSQNNPLRGARLLLNNQQFASVQESSEPMLQNQDGVVLIPEEKTPLVRAQDGQGSGTWVYRFGDRESAGESVALEVPPTADPRTTTYQTTLTWELSAVPDN
ncbi:WxL domain-containing protein [Enterococcus sp. DIV0806c]|uniref:WxL domain-containing protein n=1 Tax=Enterococcus sp. DIV0806c TaxID=2774869 RepID=UPI003F276DEA